MEIDIEKKEMNSLNLLADRVFDEWNRLLLTKDARLVSGKYLEQGELFGTVSAKIRHGRDEIMEYFEHFLKIDPSGKVVERKTVEISEDSFLDSGSYNFEVVRDGEKELIEAMFVYVWQRNEEGEWKIKHHHSAVKDNINERLNVQEEELSINEENIDWGLNENVGNKFVLQTGFVNNKRFTYLLKKDDANKKVICSMVSKIPENTGI